MRIQWLEISDWRHFRGVKLVLPDSAPIICLVGGNGTGKSQILELIAACAQRLGLAPGNESSRGDPFNDVPASFAIRFLMAPEALVSLASPEALDESYRGEFARWDRTLTIEKRTGTGPTITAGGVAAHVAAAFADNVVRIIRGSAAVHYLSLDADRAYPKIAMQPHQLGEVFDRDWDSTSKQSSFRVTRNLYDEWFRYLLGKENQDNNRHIQKIRLAREKGEQDPRFVDQFDGYRQSIKRVLPHLIFLGIDPQKKEVRFDSTGIPLSFDQLSGGEREIAFLISQIDRFALKQGLLLVDEPELHLNYDLLRTWIGFLRDTVEVGQIWLATHSLEVVEVTGQDATYLLERDTSTRRVSSATRLSSLPVVATLSRAVGSPAFSISNLVFAIVEGEELIGERERFRSLCNFPAHVRFLEGGSCREVIRRIADLKKLAAVSDQKIRIGGVVDRDWRTKSEQEELAKLNIYMLEVHEVENFFLHPLTLQELLRALGQDPASSDELIQRAADRRAGAWIFDAARTYRTFKDYPEPSKETRELVHALGWHDFANVNAVCKKIASSDTALSPEEQMTLGKHLITRAKIYSRQRTRADSLWRVCEGKEVFRTLVPQLGFSTDAAAERAIVALWIRSPAVVPAELASMRTYISAL